MLKYEPQIGRKPIKGEIIFLFNFVEKCAQNRPKADKGRYYILHLILSKNDSTRLRLGLQIGIFGIIAQSADFPEMTL